MESTLAACLKIKPMIPSEQLFIYQLIASISRASFELQTFFIHCYRQDRLIRLNERKSISYLLEEIPKEEKIKKGLGLDSSQA